jgi:potassium efflux system protein
LGGVNPVTYSGSLAIIISSVFLVLLIWIVIRFFHPSRGSIHVYLDKRKNSVLWKWRYQFYSLVIAIPISSLIILLLGYTYATIELVFSYYKTVILLICIVLVRATFERWLLITTRRLTYERKLLQRKIEDNKTSLSSDKTPTAAENIDIAEIDLKSLDGDSQGLINTAAQFLVFIGLYGIWNDVFPAFGFLDQTVLWHKTVVVDTIEHSIPVSLLDLTIAVIIAIVGYTLARRLPSLVDIILLKQGKVSSGGRYTTSTIINYLIILATIVLVFSQFGFSWSQLSWIAAALSVGIGFGLQEIFANFISGLILLFERPVRVGDIVSIGDSSGVVLRIQTRATTIQDWEFKELIVPNKELITGRVLNWTLSDSVTRILISVGIAYGSNVEKARKILTEVAKTNEKVLDEPPPLITFEEFGESSLILKLRSYVRNPMDRLPTITVLHDTINNKFKEAGISIAFPQRDIHLYTEGRGVTKLKGEVPGEKE